MNAPAIILGALCAGEAAVICFLLYTMNKIMEAVRDQKEPVEPIQWDEWED